MSTLSQIAFVVDDDPTIVLLVAQILRRNGYDTYAYTNPSLAMERAKQVPPDLLICDVFMPGDITGIDIAIKIKTMHPDTKVLILSGLTEIDDLIDEAYKCGHFFAHLAKPIFPETLLSAIKNISL